MQAIIYGLADPATGEMRYVGRSKCPERRLRQHLTSAKSNNDKKEKCHVHKWIRCLLDQKLKPVLMRLASCNSEYAEDAERFMILYQKSRGCNLTNLTEGGDGLSHVTDETRRRMSEGVKKRPPMPQEQRDGISKLFKGRISPTKGTKWSDERRAKTMKTREDSQRRGGRPKGIPVSDEAKQKYSRAAIEQWARGCGKTRKKLTEVYHS